MTCRIWFSLQAVVVLVFCSTYVSAQSQCFIGGGDSEPSDSWENVKSVILESFENATLELSYSSGFRWGASMNRSIVRDDQYVVWKGESLLDGPIMEPPRQWEGFSGSHSLRFAFPAGNNGFAEQRFSLGAAYPEVWIGYWLRVPLNWTHGSGNTNNKFFAIWMDEYERVGPTGVIQTRNSGGDSVISPYVRTRNNQHLGEESGKMLIDTSRDRGRWMQVVIHAKMATGSSDNNGIFELYRRWEGEQNFETIFRYDNWDNYHVGGNRGFAHGYIMGWANATQPEPSEWLVDDFVVSQQSLLNSQDTSAQRIASPVPKIISPLN